MPYIKATFGEVAKPVSPYARAILIGMLGPMLQVAGVSRDLLEHGVFARGALGSITFMHIVSGPAHLIIATGFVVSCICIPMAIEVAVAGVRGVTEGEPEGSLEQASGLWYGAAQDAKS